MTAQTSPFKPIPKPLYHHELRLSGCFDNTMHKSSYNSFYDRVRTEYRLESLDDFTCGIGINLSISLAYYYHFNHRWSAGIIVGTGEGLYKELAVPQPTIIIDGNEYYQQQYDGAVDCTNWYFMPSIKMNWYFWRIINLYSKVAFGAQNQHCWYNSYDRPTISERKWHPAYQLSPIGIEAGRKHFHWFGEFGYGTESIVSTGIIWRF